jgi:hypothetical protein
MYIYIYIYMYVYIYIYIMLLSRKGGSYSLVTQILEPVRNVAAPTLELAALENAVATLDA